VIELRPNVAWDKGRALPRLMRVLGLDGERGDAGRMGAAR